MTPEQIQRLRELHEDWKLVNIDAELFMSKASQQLNELLDDWERMRRQLAEIESAIKQQLEQAQESLRRRPDSVFFQGVYQASEAAAGWIEDATEAKNLDPPNQPVKD